MNNLLSRKLVAQKLYKIAANMDIRAASHVREAGSLCTWKCSVKARICDYIRKIGNAIYA
jgi:hypothetical protein